MHSTEMAPSPHQNAFWQIILMFFRISDTVDLKVTPAQRTNKSLWAYTLDSSFISIISSKSERQYLYDMAEEEYAKCIS